MALMALDLPALDRPATATSQPRSGGNWPGAATLFRNWTSGNWLTARRAAMRRRSVQLTGYPARLSWESYGPMRIAATALLTLGLIAGAARAAETPAIAGDPAAGAAKAATCTACHGVNGNSVTPEWPVIAGQGAAYVRDQVRRIRDGQRPSPLMQPMVKDLTDQDIADLAAHFSVQTPNGQEADPSYW